MRKIIYAMSVSLDGFIEAADGDFSWLYPDEELHRFFNSQEARIDVYLYGRNMYENMAAYWPVADKNPKAPMVEIEYARIWKEKPKIVFSKTLKEVSWNSRLCSGEIEKEVKKLKEQKEGTMSVSGAALARALMNHNLIDEYWLYVHPIIVGSGKPMFGELKNKIKLRLQETHTFTSGVVLLKYRGMHYERFGDPSL
ncbi:MAG: dihydrofolate reductase [Ignavibacteria bacterium]|jgi:dihydrofolate reductase|nr:dihydrofolate reductase [Ignavibacteria bacterium]MCU7504278.1 dihydrofolate reductase [Ignavibacteria bacterium]MCU7516123.1 dihydrofolate reductase [Ignavibacteria bacterium]